MPLNIKVDPTELLKAFSLNRLMEATARNLDGVSAALAAGMAAENIKITPPLSGASATRSITWIYAFPLITSDGGAYQELQQIVGTVLGLVGQNIGQGFAAGFGSASTALGSMLTAGVDIARILEEGTAVGVISTSSFDVTIERVANEPVFLGGRLSQRCRWLNTHEEEAGNKGFIEGETLTFDDHQSDPVKRHSGTGVTDPYDNELCRNHRELAADVTVVPTSFDIESNVKAVDGGFGNFATETTLKLYLATSQAALNTMMAAVTTPGTTGPGEEFVAAPQPPGNGLVPAGALLALSGGALRADVIPTNDAAVRLVRRAATGEIPHLGTYLIGRSDDELARIARGIGLKELALEKESAVRAIVKKMMRE